MTFIGYSFSIFTTPSIEGSLLYTPFCAFFHSVLFLRFIHIDMCGSSSSVELLRNIPLGEEAAICLSVLPLMGI